MPRQQQQQQHQSLLRKRRRRWVERVVVLLLLMLAWSWIVAAIVTVRHSMSSSSSSATNHRNDAIQLQQQQTFPLLIFTCRRAEYLRQTLTDVFAYLPRDCSVGCPVVISQDGHEPSVEAVVKEFQRRYPNVPIWHYQHVPSATLRLEPYKELSVHYKWAIPKVFEQVPSCQNIIILEEDLHLSPDFFSYFQRLAPLLDSKNRDFLAISAYNDNGTFGQVKNVTRVVPSDFFPGLGWMLSRKLWERELAPKWPNGYWDDWLREPDQRQGRLILRPEVSRTFHFGVKGGASGNQFGNVLGRVQLNQEPVDWNTVDVDYLRDTKRYKQDYMKLVKNAVPSPGIREALQQVKSTNTRLQYTSQQHFAVLAKSLHLMPDEKAGVPRTAYKGIVETRPNGEHFLFLVPKKKKRKHVV